MAFNLHFTFCDSCGIHPNNIPIWNMWRMLDNDINIHRLVATPRNIHLMDRFALYIIIEKVKQIMVSVIVFKIKYILNPHNKNNVARIRFKLRFLRFITNDNLKYDYTYRLDYKIRYNGFKKVFNANS